MKVLGWGAITCLLLDRKSMCKQNRPRSDCSERSSLIWDYLFASFRNYILINQLEESI